MTEGVPPWPRTVMLQEVVAPLVDDFSQMRALANAAKAGELKHFVIALEPFLLSATHHEWHLLLQHAWTNLLGPIEWQLYESTGLLISLAKAICQKCTGIEKINENAFSLRPEWASFMYFEPQYSTRRTLMGHLVRILLLVEKKRVLEVKVQRCLERVRAMHRRDNAAGAPAVEAREVVIKEEE